MQQNTMLPKLTDTSQTISFSESDDECTGEVYASNVVVETNPGTHSHGSSKVKLKSLVDYNWEPRVYPGQLLAVHLSGKYLAYCIKAPNAMNPSSWCGMVRVVYSPEPGSDRRALIKGMRGEVVDLAFAHIQHQVVLACIDEQGNFYVHQMEVTDVGLRCTLLAEIREDTGSVGGAHRVVWCPYIPDEEDDSPDDDVARLLLTTHGNIARMWNMQSVVKLVSESEGRGDTSVLLESQAVLTAREHSAAIVDAAFSPDGTALATAAADGYVMFFQVYMNPVEGAPRCLHKWQPHGGLPLSCLFFLDNHRQYNTDVQFWKFAVTGAENNTVIKIWSCKSWNCLQTITFRPGMGPEPAALGMKAMLDTSASYLILSDFRARSLYVLNMARDKDDTTAYCKSVLEFLLPYPVLSLCIVDADEEVCESGCGDPFHRNGTKGEDSPDDFDQEEAEGGEQGVPSRRVRLRLYIVQPKGLQEGELVYAPPSAQLTTEVPLSVAPSLLQQQSQQLCNLLLRQAPPGISTISTIGTISSTGRTVTTPSQRADEPLHPLTLMTPDAFSSPGKRDEDDPPLSATPDLPRPGPGAGPGVDRPLVSGASSPSREVQLIMAHTHPYSDNMEQESSQTPVPEESAIIPNGTEPYTADDIFLATEKPTKLVHSNSETSWPQISLAQITEANQRKASSEKSSSQSLNNSLNVSTVERAASEEVRVSGSGLSAADKSRLEALEQKLDRLCDLVMQQSREIRGLRDDGGAREAVEQALAEQGERTREAVQGVMEGGWERVTELSSTAAARAAQAAGMGAARALEPLAQALQRELASKLTATDHLLRDNIEKLANSKMVMERLSSSIASSLSEMVRDSLRSVMHDAVMPQMEKSYAYMFRQINQTFQTGAKEFVAQTEALSLAAAERGGAASGAALRAALDRHAQLLRTCTANATAPPAQTPMPTPAAMQAALGEAVHEVLEKELSWWRCEVRALVSQAAVNASRAHSPSTPHAHSSVHDRQMQVAQIQSLMSNGDMNGAFQQALSASDLALVVAACRAADPAIVFGPPCKLKQHVLLSLVQQLAADMTRDTQLKHRYLEEAIMNLDTTNPVAREHLPIVVRELQKQLVAFLNTHPQHALARQFKMLLMATESLIKGAV